MNKLRVISPKNISALQVIAFLTGAALMMFELVAARILAPTIGSSTYVWTSVIGTIIAALSLGYWIGGKVADRRNSDFDIVILSLASSFTVMAAAVMYPGLLPFIVDTVEDNRIQGVIASLVLFVPTSFLLGMKSPYLAKLAVKSLKTSGQSIAGLSALNSLGGIIGTFVTGFILFNYIGSRETLAIVVVLLVLSSWLILPRRYVAMRVLISIVTFIIVLIPLPKPQTLVAEVDTASAHYRVVDEQYRGKPTRLLLTGPTAAQSGMVLDDPEGLAFWYARFVSDYVIEQQPRRILVLGGGAFTLPNYLAKQLPQTQVDAVEIDPELEGISKEYFNYKDRDNLTLYFEDARTFVNQTDNEYDVVIVDVYGNTSIPFSFLTQEYTEQLDRIVSQNGKVVVNVIGGVSGACGRIVESVDAVYRPHFPYSYWQTETGTEVARGNYILLYSRDQGRPEGTYPRRQPTVSAFTDNFAPAERLHFLCQQQRN